MSYWINMITATISLVIAGVSGIFLIPFLKKLHFGQTILDIGPAWHKSKQGTPIMGGFMFIIGTIVATAVGYFIFKGNSANTDIAVSNINLGKLIAGMIMALLFSAVGFLDDYIKAVKKRNLGLKAKQKLVFQVLIAGGYLAAMYYLGDKSTSVKFPFIGDIDFSYFYYPLMILFIIFIVNAVNLTDGVDGLCGSVTVVSSLTLMTICITIGLNEQSIFAVALAGGCLGFLLWNLHPAKVFMGDTGSMFLGGAFVAIGISTGMHLLIVLIGIIYICEALSVVLQVISFKTTGKRIFKMSPIHHHFEMCKWSEYKIVIVFSTVGAIAGFIAVLIVTSNGGLITVG